MCSFKYVIISKATKYTFVEWFVDIPHKQIKKKIFVIVDMVKFFLRRCLTFLEGVSGEQSRVKL